MFSIGWSRVLIPGVGRSGSAEISELRISILQFVQVHSFPVVLKSAFQAGRLPLALQFQTTAGTSAATAH